jgi:hypothetical protein
MRRSSGTAGKGSASSPDSRGGACGHTFLLPLGCEEEVDFILEYSAEERWAVEMGRLARKTPLMRSSYMSLSGRLDLWT